MTRETREEVFHLLYAVIPAEPISWSEIVSFLKGRVRVDNWLDVRGVLQLMLDDDLIRRTTDLHKELYYKVGS